MIEDSNFVFNYVPINYAANKLEVSTDTIILEAMKGTISLYVVNQTRKILIYAPIDYLKGLENSKKMLSAMFKHFFHIGYKSIPHTKGKMLELRSVNQLDYLAKGILTEKECLEFDDERTCYLVGSIFPLFRMIHANFLFYKYRPVTLEHVFILRSELLDLKASLTAPKQLDEGEPPAEAGKLTKQEQRELIFFAWLADKDEYEVSLMKKEAVWAELRKIDPRLFSTEYKNFFRDQKRIIFKSGRKPGKEE
jgi:hypothetical protein